MVHPPREMVHPLVLTRRKERGQAGHIPTQYHIFRSLSRHGRGETSSSTSAHISLPRRHSNSNVFHAGSDPDNLMRLLTRISKTLQANESGLRRPPLAKEARQLLESAYRPPSSSGIFICSLAGQRTASPV